MSLVGCSPRGREESDMTERLHFHFSLSCIGEGNGNPLQCSCLENPRDGRAWWAAVYGVAQSRTRLKRFSSSSRQHLEKLSIWRQPRGSNPGDVITRQTQTKGELLIRYIAIKTNPCTWKRDAIPCMNNWRAWWVWKDQKWRQQRKKWRRFCWLERRLNPTSKQGEALSSTQE